MNFINEELIKLKEEGLYRFLRNMDNTFLNFSSNDYLCLSNNEDVINYSILGLKKYGFGSTGSRLTSGNINHNILEKEISDFKGTESALLFSSGYAANVGVISALCKKGDLILSDELNHASIIDGCRLSKSDVLIYKHNSVENLEYLLEKNYKNYDNIFIITDGVFSMDGDISPMDKIKKLSDEYNCQIIIDDAHGTGVLGKNGRGTLEHFNITNYDNIIQIGTLSKAFGGLGGFVCGDEALIEYLINKCRSFIYSTALPPSIVCGCIKSLEIIKEGKLLKKLKNNINIANNIFKNHNFINKEQITPIYPFIFGKYAMNIAEQLINNYGIYCVGIRYPTVPKGTERLRVSINVSHNREDFKELSNAINEIMEKNR